MFRDTLLLLRLTLRAGLLTVGLLWLVHYSMTNAPPEKTPATENFSQRLTRKCGLGRFHVRSLVQELGPAVADELRQGKTVYLPGLGTLRVVEGPPPTFIASPAGFLQTSPRKGVEFVPTTELLNAVQAPQRTESARTFAIAPNLR